MVTWISIAALFFVANRGATRGYFSNDDLANLAHARETPLSYYLGMLLNPLLPRDTAFRPLAALFYYIGARVFDLYFPPYVVAIHILHLVNVVLVWIVARSLKASLIGAFAASLLFAFHAGTLAIYWAPMYVFDLMCATFVLLTLLTYARGHLFLSLLCFWLSLKSKEIAITLPLALAAYELLLADRRWKRLLPFFAISVFLGAQALLANTHRDNDYSFRFAPSSLWTCAKFYATKLTLAPETIALVAILILLILALALPSKLGRFGILVFLVLLLPMLGLPGRLFGAYLYVPLIGLALVISAVTRPAILAVFFLLWIPLSYRQFRFERSAEIAAANDRRAWVEPVIAFARAHPSSADFVYDGNPDAMELFGMSGAIRAARGPDAESRLIAFDSDQRLAAFAHPDSVLLTWDPIFHVEHVLPRQPDVAYIKMSRFAPQWQLLDGWIDESYNFRWIAPDAAARLAAPPAARTFELVVYPPDFQIAKLHQLQIRISINHQPIGAATLDRATPLTFRFPVPKNLAPSVDVEFHVSPPFPDPGGSPKVYGIPVGAFGFLD